MNTSTHNEPIPTAKVADEFASWPMTEPQVQNANMIRGKFDELLTAITSVTPAGNARYLALVKTKLEEASFFAVKAIAKPTN